MVDRHDTPVVSTIVQLLVVCGLLTIPLSTPAQGLDLRKTLRFAAEMAKGGSWREARFRWTIADGLDPDNARVQNNLAVASEALGDFEEARRHYDRALALNPEDPHIQDNHRRFSRFLRELEALSGDKDNVPSEAEAQAPSYAAAGKKKGKIERVPVELPMPPRLKLEGKETLLVTSLLADETDLLDINREMVRFLRSEFSKRTALEVLDVVPPPAIPEQTVADLLANTEFWKHLHREYGADLIVSGTFSYVSDDVSGFEDVDLVSPRTGQKVRQVRFVEREKFLYSLEVFFIDGPTGTLRFRDRLERGAVFRGANNDPITAFYELSDSIADDVLAVVVSRVHRDTRVIFKR